MTLRFLLPFSIMLFASPSFAQSPMAAQVCGLLTSSTLTAVQARMGTGEGCAWQWSNGQVLSVYVHVDKQPETVTWAKEVMDLYLRNPAFKRTTLQICNGGDVAVADFRNGKGPGGTGYAQCSGFVLTFSFQGTDAQNHLPGIAKKLTGTTFAR